VPNSGGPPDRPRLDHKLAFMRALRRRMEQLSGEGRQVRGGEQGDVM
jgi:hypothetical protein